MSLARRSTRPAPWVLHLVLAGAWLAACAAQDANNCSTTCAATATLQRAGNGQLDVKCSPKSLQQVPGLVLHPLLLDLPGEAHCRHKGTRDAG